MRRNTKIDTKPEVLLRSALHAHGLRFRKNLLIRLSARSVRPDIVFTRKKIAVFVDGCFWHRCPEHGTKPRANGAFWQEKLDRNVQRDREADAALSESGWTVLRCWEHEPPEDAAERVLNALPRRGGPGSNT
jgi:DNA mismatch endonuclease (patch repair protein)